MDGFVEFTDHLARTKAFSVLENRLDQIRQHVQQRHIARDGVNDTGAHQFHRHLAPGQFAAADGGEMHLCDRSARDRRQVEIAEYFLVSVTIAVQAIQN